MPALWEIERGSDGQRDTVEGWGDSGATVRFGNQIADVLRFSDLKAKCTDPKDFQNGELITLYKDGDRYFEGVVKCCSISGDDRREGQDYEIAGPWDCLERIVYQQQWFYPDPDNPPDSTANPPIPLTYIGYYQSHVALYQDDNGDPMSTTAQLIELLQCALQAGAEFQIGKIAIDFIIPPFVEVSDITTADAIRQVLRWHPTATVWWDYSTSPPTVNICDRDELAADLLPIGEKPVCAFSIKARHDLLPSCVVIHWEVVGTINDGLSVRQKRELVTDAAPFGVLTDGKKKDALVYTLQADGVNATAQTQEVRTCPIPPDECDEDFPGRDAAWELAAKKWWIKHIPALSRAGVTPADISLAEGCHCWAFDKRETDPDQNVADGIYAPGTDDDNIVADEEEPADLKDYPRELIEGEVADWMQRDACPYIIRGVICWEGDADSEVARKVFGSARQPKEFQVQITATNAITGIYRGLGSFTQADELPIGLASHIWRQIEDLQYEGRVKLTQQEVCDDPSPRPGRVLNFDKPGYENINAVVQTATENLENGTTTVIFGPSGSLGLNEWYELLRLGRISQPARFSKRQRGEADIGNAATEIRDEIHQPRQNLEQEQGDDCRFKVTAIPFNDEFRVFVGSGSILTPGISCEQETAPECIFPEWQSTPLNEAATEYETLSPGDYCFFVRIPKGGNSDAFWLELGSTATVEQESGSTYPDSSETELIWPLGKLTLNEDRTSVFEACWCSDIPFYLVNMETTEKDIITAISMSCESDTCDCGGSGSGSGAGGSDGGTKTFLTDVSLTLTKCPVNLPRWISTEAEESEVVSCNSGGSSSPLRVTPRLPAGKRVFAGSPPK